MTQNNSEAVHDTLSSKDSELTGIGVKVIISPAFFIFYDHKLGYSSKKALLNKNNILFSLFISQL